MTINKQALVELIISDLQQALNQAISAANEAHAAAVDDQSVAETQYDTLAIEASYLAEGQSKRVQELQKAIYKCFRKTEPHGQMPLLKLHKVIVDRMVLFLQTILKSYVIVLLR